MPKTRVIERTFAGGVVVEEKTRLISDAELAVEAAEAETAQANDQDLVAWQGWASLTLTQKDNVLKALLGDFISRHRENYI